MKKPIWMALGLTIIVVGSAFILWRIVGPGSHQEVPPPDELVRARDILQEWDRMKPDARKAAAPDLADALDKLLKEPEKPGSAGRGVAIRSLFVLFGQKWPSMDPDIRQITTPVLVRSLKFDDDQHRLAVALAADKAGKDALPELLNAARDSDENIRYYAIWGLGRLGPDATEALPAVTASLKDANAEVRRKAVWGVSRLQRKPDKALPLLSAALDDDDDEVRKAAADAMATYGKASVPALREELQGLNFDKKRAALHAIQELGPDAVDALPELVALLKPDSGQSEEAAAALARLGPPAIPVLTGLLKSDEKLSVDQVMTGVGSVWAMVALLPNNFVQRRLAMSALSKVGRDAVEVLIAALEDPDPDVRAQAAGTLRGLGFSDRRILIGLADLLRDPSESVRGQAVLALAALVTEPRSILRELQRAVQDPDIEVRVNAVECLRRLGSSTLPLLLGALRDANVRVRDEAARSLQGLTINNDVLAATVVPMLKENNAEVRMHAVTILIRCGPQVLPHLLPALKDSDVAVRRKAIVAVAAYAQPRDKEMQQTLLDALKDDDAAVRNEAVGALARFGLDAVPALIEMMNDADEAVRTKAKDSLLVVAPENKKVMPLLTQALKHEARSIRQGAAFTMKRFGADATPALLEALKDKDEDVQYAAVYALDDVADRAHKAYPQAFGSLAEVALNHPVEKTRLLALRGMMKMYGMEEDWREPVRTVRRLVQLLQEKKPTMRREAAVLLAVIGPPAQDAVPALTKALKDPEPKVAESAKLALERIQKKAE